MNPAPMLIPYSRAIAISACEDGPSNTGSARAENSSRFKLRKNQYPVIQHSGNAMISAFCWAALSTKRLIVARFACLSPGFDSNWTEATLMFRMAGLHYMGLFDH